MRKIHFVELTLHPATHLLSVVLFPQAADEKHASRRISLRLYKKSMRRHTPPRAPSLAARALPAALLLSVLLAIAATIFSTVALRRRGGGGGGGALVAGASAPSLAVRSSLAEGPAAPRTASAAGAAPAAPADEGPIHVAVAHCGARTVHEPDQYGLLQLKSVLLARANSASRRRRYVFHVLSNSDREQIMSEDPLHAELERFVRADALLEMRFYKLTETGRHAALQMMGLHDEGAP